MKISRHAKKRMKERLGIPIAAQKRHIETVLTEGLEHKDLSGKLRRYIDKLWLSHKTLKSIMIYGRHSYLFGSSLVTVIHIPASFHKTIEAIKTKLTKDKDNG